MRDVLLQIDSYPDPTPAAAIQAAVAFAEAIGAQLSALAVQVDLPVASHALAGRLIDLSGLQKDWEARSQAACEAAVKTFEQAAKAAGVYASAQIERIHLHDIDDVVARHVRTRDLCILPLSSSDDDPIELAQQVIFHSGRPVLAFPVDRILSARRVAVAWDGSRSAARALADALPILGRAEAVRVVTFVNEKETAGTGLGNDVVRHLRSHGIAASTDEVDVAGRRIGRAIDDYLAEAKADLLVMGAYGHSRLREFVLGGATEHVLRHPHVAALFSH